MIYLHICGFKDEGWAFVPSESADLPSIKTFGLKRHFGDKATPNYATREACEKAAEAWARQLLGSSGASYDRGWMIVQHEEAAFAA